MQTNDSPAARPMEPIKFGNLLINFTTEFYRIWDTKGSRSAPATFWRPTPAPDALPGYFPLGDIAVSGDLNINGKRVTAVVCEGDPQGADSLKGKALSPPDDFEQVWKDSGSGSTVDGAIWRPIPPDGYVALGLVCSNGHAKPSLNAVRCVRSDLVVASSVGDTIWSDRGSGAKQNFSAWSLEPPAAAAGEINFAPGTFVGVNSYTQPATHVAAYSLRMQIPLQIISTPEVPVLTGFGFPPTLDTSRATQIARIPWFAVKDDTLSPVEKLNKSPFYRLERTDEYQLIGYAHNEGAKGRFFKWAVPRGLVRSILQIFTNTTSIKFETEWPIEASDAVRPINFSARLDRNFARTEASAAGWSSPKTAEVVAIAPKSKLLAVYQLQSHYDLLREDGTQAGINLPYTDNDSFYLAEYPPEESEVNASQPTATDTSP
ncbi:hypothetical protein CRX42_11540 [Pseudomonas jessenii]|jgi:hypothetical protein|uniref:DUF946 domain-containing protein n=1 Tax=Pseudomonas jessenii TaxID=77298 RepID=A0A2W0EPP1_PSEJE|nr:Vps62-related protein [Pseudomonas jessenii]PYY70403.1 hypothetical protein CRX42_11540 [Pseudomonas jessenii]